MVSKHWSYVEESGHQFEAQNTPISRPIPLKNASLSFCSSCLAAPIKTKLCTALQYAKVSMKTIFLHQKQASMMLFWPGKGLFEPILGLNLHLDQSGPAWCPQNSSSLCQTEM